MRINADGCIAIGSESLKGKPEILTSVRSVALMSQFRGNIARRATRLPPITAAHSDILLARSVSTFDMLVGRLP